MSPQVTFTLAPIIYVLSASAFIVGLKMSAHVRTLTRGWSLIVAGLVLAAVGGLVERGAGGSAALVGALAIGLVVGALLGGRVMAGATPGRVAWIPGIGGVAAALVALDGMGGADAFAGVAGGLAALLGGLSVLSAVAATLGSARAAGGRAALAAATTGLSVGLLGFVHDNVLLLVVGGTAGTAGIALARIMAASAGRGLAALIFGGAPSGGSGDYANLRSCGTEEAGMMIEAANSVVIVPGFGMAAAQAQHAVKELAEQIEKRGGKVVYAVHPAAGCLPGHMNIVLDEANVPHEQLVDLEAANLAIKDADVVLVVGANDVVNGAAESDAKSPLAGMPIIRAHEGRTVFVIKRTLGPGANGVKNPLFENPATTLILGDAKRVAQALVVELKGAGH